MPHNWLFSSQGFGLRTELFSCHWGHWLHYSSYEGGLTTGTSETCPGQRQQLRRQREGGDIVHIMKPDKKAVGASWPLDVQNTERVERGGLRLAIVLAREAHISRT